MWIKSWLETMIAFIIDCQSLITLFRGYPLLYTVLEKYAHKNPSSIHQISNKYRYLCSQPSQQKDFIQKKQTRDLGYIESTNKLKKAPNSSVRSWRNSSQNLNHYSTTNSAPKPGQGPHGTALEPSVCKVLIFNSRLKLHREIR